MAAIQPKMSFGDVQFFDRKQDVAITARKLPHWSQAGTLCFITFRTCDSIPKAVLQDWIEARNDWLVRHRIDMTSWKQDIEHLPIADQQEFHRLMSDRWHDDLDACHGRCALRRSAVAAIVEKSLKHFQGTRYLLTDYVIMPNHVHLLAAFIDEQAMLKQCASWKRYTATRINRILKGTGSFWQEDAFDHLVRSEAQFAWLRRYIAENPINARLSPDEYRHETLM